MNYFCFGQNRKRNMKKTFQKTLLAAAAGVALMGTASANSLLFPYWTTATGAQSVLSLSNAGTSVAAATQTIHYVYNYGSSCTHYDANGSMTANDILSHSIAATTAGGFGKVVSSDTSTPVYFPLSGQTGFLVVSSKSTASTDALRGSMAIVDPNTGLVVSYQGIDNGLATNAAGAVGEGDYSAAAFNDTNFLLTFLPSSMVTTSWYAVILGDMHTAINTGANWAGAYTFTNNGFVYNNDETPYSGTATKSITCAGSLVATDLGTGAQNAAVGGNGGMIKATAGTAAGGATGVVMMKMQTVQASVGAPFAGKQFLHREQAGQ